VIDLKKYAVLVDLKKYAVLVHAIFLKLDPVMV
jgi:hypothetical protein